MSCPINPASENYADFIHRYGSEAGPSDSFRNDIVCSDFAFPGYSILYVPSEAILPLSLEKYPYYSIPKLYTTMDTSALDASGISTAAAQPALGSRGRGTIIGFIDTGIDYRNPVFQNPNGTTRIIGIWDQTLPPTVDPENLENSSESQPIQYGTFFTREQINEALASSTPLSLVPSTDTNGHGTFLAGVAAGSPIPEQDFIGAAPDAAIAMVRLKPAKQYLREFFCIPENAVAFQENDIIMGIRYLTLLAQEYRMPLTICLGLGTNSGSHEGSSPLSQALRYVSQYIGICAVTAAGNETGLSHHYAGSVPSDSVPDEVAIRVGNSETGFVTELWSSTPELYTVGFVSPSGEEIGRIPLTLSSNTTVSFLLEPTVITVYYRPHEIDSGKQLIFMKFLNPIPGEWRIRVYSNQILNGDFHMWLPAEGLISPETVFLSPNPNTTITSPGNAPATITAAAYNHLNGSINIHSSRGYTIDSRIKPDLAAPGVEVYGPGQIPEAAYSRGVHPDSLPMTRKTGTSVAAALTAGSVASLLSWGLVWNNDPGMSGAAIRSYLIRGADRNRPYTFPNREWGYGSLNLYNTFLWLREL